MSKPVSNPKFGDLFPNGRDLQGQSARPDPGGRYGGRFVHVFAPAQRRRQLHDPVQPEMPWIAARRAPDGHRGRLDTPTCFLAVFVGANNIQRAFVMYCVAKRPQPLCGHCGQCRLWQGDAGRSDCCAGGRLATGMAANEKGSPRRATL
jgi:hypothetical protein